MRIDQPQAMATIALCEQKTPFSISGQFHHWIATMALRFQVRRERKELSSLPDNLLTDVGISRQQACNESARSFNDLPESRTQQ